MGIPRRKRLPKLEEFGMFDDAFFAHLYRSHWYIPYTYVVVAQIEEAKFRSYMATANVTKGGDACQLATFSQYPSARKSIDPLKFVGVEHRSPS